MVLAAVLGSLTFRCCYDRLEITGYRERWYAALAQLVFPPLLLISTALAVVCMGTEGEMVWAKTAHLSYGISSSFLGIALGLLILSAASASKQTQSLRRYPKQQILGMSCRLFECDIPFSAVVGLWKPELAVGRGLLDRLDETRLKAVLAHEQAHLYYRDTFWFFWLGWLKRLTRWLPKTEAVWQELLLLREIRADRWAAQQVDGLLLAESLLTVAKAPFQPLPCDDFGDRSDVSAALSCDAPRSRLEERIEALLEDTPPIPNWQPCLCQWLALAFVPMSIVPFHY
ncbi:MAG: M56 family metallopeptidase [Baaleninema sp.]